MKQSLILITIAFLVLSCTEKPAPFIQSETMKIESLTATPSVVPAGQESVIVCKLSGTTGSNLKYKWSATGNYGYLTDKDSICIFGSPSCHSGPATVTVVVTDENNESVRGAVNLNESGI